MIGIDSCAIIDLFKGDEAIKELLMKIEEPIALSYLTYLELMFGLDLKNQKHKIEEEFYDDLFSSNRILNLTKESCKKASLILSNLKKSGKIIDEMDASIAGIFLSNGISKIITRNSKHFEKIPELKVISY